MLDDQNESPAARLPRLNPLQSLKVVLPARYVRGIGHLRKHLAGAQYCERSLDDLMATNLELSTGRWRAVPIIESMPFKCLQGEKQSYLEYIRYIRFISRSPDYGLETFEKLVDSVLDQGYPAGEEYIILHGDEPYIHDGQHRAAILRYYLGNVKVPVVRLNFTQGFEGWRRAGRLNQSSQS